MPLVNEITRCYLPPDSGERPAFTPNLAGWYSEYCAPVWACSAHNRSGGHTAHLHYVYHLRYTPAHSTPVSVSPCKHQTTCPMTGSCCWHAGDQSLQARGLAHRSSTLILRQLKHFSSDGRTDRQQN